MTASIKSLETNKEEGKGVGGEGGRKEGQKKEEPGELMN